MQENNRRNGFHNANFHGSDASLSEVRILDDSSIMESGKSSQKMTTGSENQNGDAFHQVPIRKPSMTENDKAAAVVVLNASKSFSSGRTSLSVLHKLCMTVKQGSM
jgi:hypothetical protein